METKQIPDGLSRRQLLTRIVGLTGTAATAPILLNTSFSESVLASEQGKRLLPTYVAGSLVQIEAGRMVLSVPGYVPDMVEVAIPDGIEICRRTRTNDWTALQLGDRIDTRTHFGARGGRLAEWIVANGIASWGIVAGSSGAVLRLDPMPGMRSFERELVIEPYTRINHEGGEEYGSIRRLRPGDAVHFTGTAAGPNRFSKGVWALVVTHTGYGA